MFERAVSGVVQVCGHPANRQHEYAQPRVNMLAALPAPPSPRPGHQDMAAGGGTPAARALLNR
jgi:hypothetical protein